MRFLFAFALSLSADVFTDQYRQIEQYYLAEIRKASGAGQFDAVPPLPASQPARTSIALWPDARVEELRLQVEPGHFAHALLLTPVAGASKAMIAMGPADRTPEGWAGLGAEAAAPWLASLLHAGYAVCLPITVQRTKDHPLSTSTRGKDRRHILHRLAFVTGRTVLGLEVTEVRGLAAALNMPVGLYGEADGAWTALFAAHVDQRFTSLNLVDWRDPGEALWREPVDRTVFGMARVPAPRLKPVTLPEAAALRKGDPLIKVEIEERRNRHYNGLLEFARARIRNSAAERARRTDALADLRMTMGPIPAPTAAMNPRVTEIARKDRFTAYEVFLHVLPGVEAYGHLLVPQGGSKHAAVIAQHGLGGKPKDLTLQGPEPNAAYHGFAARLAEHGYVVFAPYVTVPIPQAELINPLARMANVLGRMRTNVEVAKLRRIVDYLQSRPDVDPARIGYYGLSYGGYSAIWMAPLEPRIRATVISGHFNDWTPKITNEVETTSYLQHPDEDFYNWNVLNRLTHFELIKAFRGRPVMIEFALHDGTTFPAWHEKAWNEVKELPNVARDRFIGIHEVHGIGAFDFLDRWLRPEEPSSRSFEHWGEATHTLETAVRGTFRVGSRNPRFRGLAFRADGPLRVRFQWGSVTAESRNGWAEARVSERLLDPGREYTFELQPAGSPVKLTAPKPLGGTRLADEFAPAYRPLQ